MLAPCDDGMNTLMSANIQFQLNKPKKAEVDVLKLADISKDKGGWVIGIGFTCVLPAKASLSDKTLKMIDEVSSVWVYLGSHCLTWDWRCP